MVLSNHPCTPLLNQITSPPASANPTAQPPTSYQFSSTSTYSYFFFNFPKPPNIYKTIFFSFFFFFSSHFFPFYFIIRKKKINEKILNYWNQKGVWKFFEVRIDQSGDLPNEWSRSRIWPTIWLVK